jgi:HEPN domain-containing protein
MPHDLVLKETAEWLKKASTDLRSCKVGLGAEPPTLEDVVFHAQQAVEKTFKAFLTFHSRPFRKTHDIEEIGSIVTEIDPTLEKIIFDASMLTPFAWQFRYPGESAEPELEEAQRAASLAQDVYKTVLSKLPPGVDPEGKK